MKKLQVLTVGVLSIVFVLFLLMKVMTKTSGENREGVLNIYNWGDYIDPKLLTKFEQETGYQVVYETFDSNEAMFTKVQQGGTAYDITIPSEYMIQKMKKEKLLIKLEKEKVKGLDNIDSKFLGQSFDQKNDYSVPYFWGTLGIVYNKKMISTSPPKHWEDLWKKTYRNNLMLIDGAREVLGFSLDSLGYSINSTDMNQINQAVKKLKQLTPNIKAIVADEIKMYMVQNEASAAVTFSGEAAQMLEQNENLHYVVPTEGSNLWFDNMVIPKTARNIKGAYAFINFMLRPENAAQNALYIGYATPNKKAKELLPKKIREDKQFYPDEEVIERLEVYKDLGKEWLGIYNDKFLQVKMYRK